MAIQERADQGSLGRYIEEVRAAWGDGKDPDLPLKVKKLLENLLRTTDPQEPWMAELLAQGLPSRELYRDPEFGFIQMGHVHKQGHGNTPHDHGPCWVLYGCYQGLTEITSYRRTDQGKVSGKATLEKKELNKLSPGVVIPYLAGDIHSTFAAERSVVFRFLSYDLNKIERFRYNLEKGTVSPA